MSESDRVLADDRRREARLWLQIAREDARVCDLCLTAQEPAIRPAAYHCQQAAEKLIKGLLVMAGVHFPKTHDMEALGDLAISQYAAWTKLISDTFSLTDWAWVYRYPGLEEEADPSHAELTEALATIAQLTACLASMVEDTNPGPAGHQET